MPWDSGLEEVSIVVRVIFEPLGPARPGAGVEKLDEHAGDWQGGMHRGSNSLELIQAGLPGAELVIPQVDDSYRSRIGDELMVTCTVVWLEQRDHARNKGCWKRWLRSRYSASRAMAV